MLQPKITKFRKYQKGLGRSKAKLIQHVSHRLSFGSYGLQSQKISRPSGNQSQIKASQIEAFRKVIIRRIRKIGKI